jgi:hypothetical protein
MITETQDLILKLIEKVSFNTFSGPSVVRDLKEHENLWRSLTMTRFVHPVYQKLVNPVTSPSEPPIAIYHKADLSPLRDIPTDSFSADTLIIYSEPGKQAELEVLAQRWKADSFHWVCADEAFRAMGTTWRKFMEFSREDRVLLVLWWD